MAVVIDSVVLKAVNQHVHWTDRIGHAVLILIAAALLAFLAAPLAAILLQSVESKDGAFVGLDNFIAYVQTPTLKQSLWNSVWVSATVTLIAVPAAFLFAYALTRSCMPLKGLFRTITLTPLLAPSLLAATGPGRIAGALINDIGPDIETGGLDRIRSVVGKSQSFPTWVHASRWISEVQGHVFPNFGLTDWLAMAKRTCRLTAQGRVAPDYDMRIADPMKLPAEAADLWPAYRALGDVPVTILRGSLSDILTDATAKRMVKELPKVRLVTVKKVGHAPALDEPESVKAIDALLASIT